MCVCVCVTQGGRGKGVFEFDNRNLSYMHPSITFKTHYTSQQLQFNAGCIVDLSTKQELTGWLTLLLRLNRLRHNGFQSRNNQNLSTQENAHCTHTHTIILQDNMEYSITLACLWSSLQKINHWNCSIITDLQSYAYHALIQQLKNWMHPILINTLSFLLHMQCSHGNTWKQSMQSLSSNSTTAPKVSIIWHTYLSCDTHTHYVMVRHVTYPPTMCW